MAMIIQPLHLMQRITNDSQLNIKPQYLVYTIESINMNCRGLVACISMNNYKTDKILLHENIISGTMTSIKNELQDTKCQKTPIILAHKPCKDSYDLLNHYSSFLSPPDAAMIVDGALHAIWYIRENQLIEHVSSIYEKIKYCWVADGHHRLAAFNELNKNPLNSDGFNRISALFVDESQLNLNCYHRAIVNHLPMSPEELLNQSARYFHIDKLNQLEEPVQPNEFCFCVKNECYKMYIKQECYQKNVSAAFYIEKIIFDHILSWNKKKIEKNISYLPGGNSLDILSQDLSSKKYHCVFLLPKPGLQDIEKLFFAPHGQLIAHYTHIQPKPLQLDALLNFSPTTL